MKKEIIIILLISLSIAIASILIIFPKSDNPTLPNVEYNELFDIDHYLESQLVNHTFKIITDDRIYDRYLVEADYVLWSENIPLNDPIIKFQFDDSITFDKNDTGPANPNTIVIYPTFTSAAYYQPGFYTYFAGACDESCITDLSFASPELKYTSSGMTTQLLRALGYNFISDVDVDKNPEILKNYDTLILLHNEYVTKKMFDAISNHPNIIFLFPNALYAEIEVNHDDQTMTLIRGHNYPQLEIKNGFDYVIEEQFHEYEYDSDCFDWEFAQFENGHALTCYPDAVIWDRPEILAQLKYLTLVN
tara:strand:- start:227 stop:1141 length:915 start_codon:yes stop_codon:yes gene_type:complete